ncbi:uncharacterized protein AC631_01771 [Debaryomyces fabryi]|uniref:Uncharacterized protein n=1 Tax=Debaryomyces fabryi TaxID=58627 RepID=A0A0V1Q229_9ASCO|nr:uncharacterized protein AC631_01771 [Debaryomyces fabryi]KSA02498.1 hypothetical protein AC631_01771 [Debaryomyces fabryi]CUM50402.1 unnamed protein product [Debaryomyces fabryi]
MTGVYIEGTSTGLSFYDTGLNFSLGEIDAIKNIWRVLGIVTASGFAGSNPQFDTSTTASQEQDEEILQQDEEILQRFIPGVAKLNIINMNSGSSVEIDERIAEEFAFKLKSNLLHYTSLHYNPKESYKRNDFDDFELEDEEFDYHLPDLIRLISNIIYDLENIHNNDSGVIKTAKICSRIWNYEMCHYKLVGEALTLTILDQVGRNRFSPELEYTWLKFYNIFSNLLQTEGEDPFFDLPIHEEMSRSRFPSDTLTLSTISPRSSINFPDDDIYSIRELPSVDQDFGVFSLLNGINEEDEDGSYDLINVFGYDRSETKSPSKKGYRSSLTRFRTRRKSLV